MKPFRLLAMTLFTLTSLLGCSRTVMPSSPSSFDYSLTVATDSNDTVEGLESLYGGKVMLWQPQDGFAVLGLDHAHLSAQGSVKVQPNRSLFWGGGQLAWLGGSVSAWAGGSVSAWAGGSVSAWAGGSVSAWAGGIYQPLPHNTSKWQSLNLQQAQALANNLGAGIKVAVIDSGIDLEHPAFVGGLAPASQMWDYVANDGVPQEEGTLGIGAFGHGTNVASIILQIAPKAKILPLRVLGPDGSGDAINVAAAISRAVSKGATIINLSLGSEIRSDAVAEAIAAATSKGVYVIASSGNTANSNITYPASDASADTTTLGRYSVSVGSVDAEDKKSSFSSYGLALEMVGPGELVYGPVPGKRLGAWSGTSMAAPMVSGALALALGQTIYVPRADLTDLLESRAANIYSKGLNSAYEDEAQGLHFLGEGRLDVEHFIYDATRP